MIKQGYVMRLGDGRFVPSNAKVGEMPPWVYTQQFKGLRCDINQAVFWEIYKHIPTQCRNCWKVVVRPRTLKELFDLYELQKDMGVPCKCGMEVRDTVCCGK